LEIGSVLLDEAFRFFLRIQDRRWACHFDRFYWLEVELLPAWAMAAFSKFTYVLRI
jgi:hypothetical protein